MHRHHLTPVEYLRRPYKRVIVPDPESGTYAAMIQEFPGCITQGGTPDEAYHRLHDAGVSWIEAALDLGQAIPEPEEENTFSGKFPLRMPKTTHRDAAEAAARNGTSLNQFIVAAVSERVGANKLYAELARRMERRFFASTGIAVAAIERVISQLDFGTKTASTPPGRSTDFRVSHPTSTGVN